MTSSDALLAGVLPRATTKYSDRGASYAGGAPSSRPFSFQPPTQGLFTIQVRTPPLKSFDRSGCGSATRPQWPTMLKCSMATMLHEYFNSGQNRPTFLSPFDAVQPGVALDALNRFDQYWNNPSQGFQTRTYIASISEHDPVRRSPRPSFDVASFRRKRFGPRCHGFRVPRYSEALGFLNCMFSPVAYLSRERAYEIIAEIIANISREQGFLRTHPRRVFQLGFLDSCSRGHMRQTRRLARSASGAFSICPASFRRAPRLTLRRRYDQ